MCAQHSTIEEQHATATQDLLPGTWELLYTTAPDVLPLVVPATIPLVPRAGRIYQRFSSLEEGRVENVIKVTVPGLLDPNDGGMHVRIMVY